MTYIIQVPSRSTSGPSVRYLTAVPEAVVVRFREKHRKTGTLGGFNVVEHAGWDKSTVVLGFKRSERGLSHPGVKGANGSIGTSAHPTFRLLDRNRHIRQLTDADVAVLADWDKRIAEREAELKEIRGRRVAFVKEAWTRGEKVSMSELEEKVNAS